MFVQEAPLEEDIQVNWRLVYMSEVTLRVPSVVYQCITESPWKGLQWSCFCLRIAWFKCICEFHCNLLHRWICNVLEFVKPFIINESEQPVSP